jgi:hypothetical protein
LFVVFVRVAAWEPLVVPTICLANVSEVGVRVTGAAEPLPVRLTVCGLFEAPSVIVRVPFLVPVAVGVNVMLMVQLEDGAKLVPQVVVCA